MSPPTLNHYLSVCKTDSLHAFCRGGVRIGMVNMEILEAEAYIKKKKEKNRERLVHSGVIGC